MLRTGVGNSLVYVVVALFGCLSIVVACSMPAEAQTAGTTVGATVCVASSSITITSPANDSVVSAPQVTLAGTVNQANQIEVYVDDALDHVIPLSIGQATYSDSVELTEGTHTIKVTAVNTCPGPDGVASSVVTYTPSASPTPPPSSSSSTGNTVPTTVGQPVDSSQQIQEKPSSFEGLPKLLTMPFQSILGWLNINTADSHEGHGLTVWRALVIAGGLYLLIVGMATVVVQMALSLPFIAAIVPAVSPSARLRWMSGVFRLCGLLLILLALFI